MEIIMTSLWSHGKSPFRSRPAPATFTALPKRSPAAMSEETRRASNVQTLLDLAYSGGWWKPWKNRKTWWKSEGKWWKIEKILRKLVKTGEKTCENWWKCGKHVVKKQSWTMDKKCERCRKMWRKLVLRPVRNVGLSAEFLFGNFSWRLNHERCGVFHHGRLGNSKIFLPIWGMVGIGFLPIWQ